MPLAPQVANPGSRGQDSRYKFDPSYMVDLGGGIVTDGVWHYDMASNGPDSMLSLDRPSINAGNLPPADDTDSVMRYSQSLRPGQGVGTQGGPAAPPPPPQREFTPLARVKMGQQIPDRPFFDIGPQSWSDPNYGAQNKQQFSGMLDSLFSVIQKNNPGLYKDRAAFNVDRDAILAGNPNMAPRPYTPPKVAPTNPLRPIQPQTKQPAVLPARVIPVKAPPRPNPILSTAGTRPPILPKKPGKK